MTFCSRVNIARTASSPTDTFVKMGSEWEAGRESRRVSGEVAAYSDARTRPSRGEMACWN